MKLIVDYKNNNDEITQIRLGKSSWDRWQKSSTRPGFVKTILKVTKVTGETKQELYSFEKNDNSIQIENNNVSISNTSIPTFDASTTNFNEQQFSAPTLSTPIPGRSLGPTNTQLLGPLGVQQPAPTTSMQNSNPMSISFLTSTSTQHPIEEMPSVFQTTTNTRQQSASTVVSTSTRSNEIPLKSPIKDDNDLIVIYKKGPKKTRTSKNIKGSDLNSWISEGAHSDNNITSLKNILEITDVTERKIFSSEYIDWIKEREGTTTKKSRISSKDRLKIFYEQYGKTECKTNVLLSTWEDWNEENDRKKFKSGEYVLLEQVTKVVTVDTKNVEREIYPIHHDNHAIKMTYKDPNLRTKKTMIIYGEQLRSWIEHGLSSSNRFGNFEDIIKLRDTVTKKKIKVDLIRKLAEQAKINQSSTDEQLTLSEVTISLVEQRVPSPTASPSSLNQNEIQPSSLNPDHSPDFQAQTYSPSSSPMSTLPLDCSVNNSVEIQPLLPSAMTILSPTVLNLVDIKRSLLHVDLMCSGEGEPTGDSQEEQPFVSIANLSVPATPVDLNFQSLYEEESLQQDSFTAEKNSSNQKKNEEGTKYKISYTDKLAKENIIEIPRKAWLKYRKKWQGLSVLNTSDLYATDLNMVNVDVQKITSIIQIVNGKETLIYPLVGMNDIEVTYVSPKTKSLCTLKMSKILVDGRILQGWIDTGNVGIAIRDFSKITRLYDTVLKKDIDLDFIKALLVEAKKNRPQQVAEKQQCPEPVFNTAVPTSSIDLSKASDLEGDKQKEQSDEQSSSGEKQFSATLFPNLSVSSSPMNSTIHQQENEVDKREGNLPEQNDGSVVNFSVFSQSNVTNTSSSQLSMNNAENNIRSSNVSPDQRNLIRNSISYTETVKSLSSQLTTLKRKNQGKDKEENENKKKKTQGEMQGEVNQQVKKS